MSTGTGAPWDVAARTGVTEAMLLATLILPGWAEQL